MLKHRVIPCLLLHKGGLVKTVKFTNPKYVGDPLNAIRIFNDKEVDELMVLDISATREGREPNYELIERFAGECFMPVCSGGGVRTVGAWLVHARMARAFPSPLQARRSVMRRALVGGFLVGGTAPARRQPLAQTFQLAAQPRQLIAELQHRLVLLGHVPLQVGDLLLERSKAFVHRRKEPASRSDGWPSASRARAPGPAGSSQDTPNG